MRRPGKSRYSQGLLLFEAALTVTIIAVSLVFLTRSFGASLRALSQARRYESAIDIAERRLRELEAVAETAQPLSGDQSGELDTPTGRVQWSVGVQSFQAPHELLNGDKPAIDRLTVTVTELRDASPIEVSLTTLVPRAWIPETWARH